MIIIIIIVMIIISSNTEENDGNFEETRPRSIASDNQRIPFVCLVKEIRSNH